MQQHFFYTKLQEKEDVVQNCNWSQKFFYIRNKIKMLLFYGQVILIYNIGSLFIIKYISKNSYMCNMYYTFTKLQTISILVTAMLWCYWPLLWKNCINFLWKNEKQQSILIWLGWGSLYTLGQCTLFAILKCYTTFRQAAKWKKCWEYHLNVISDEYILNFKYKWNTISENS